MKALKEKKYAPIYYLMGEEAYYIDKISDYIAEHVLAPEERDFNQTILFGSDVTAAAVADMRRKHFILLYQKGRCTAKIVFTQLPNCRKML